jgi:putative hydrolase of the HAD superfamily
MRRRRSAARPILAVTFDVGGTLIRPWPSVGHVYARVAARHGIGGVSAASLSRGFKRVWSRLEGFDYSRGSWRKVVVETFRKAGASIPDSDCFGDIYRTFGRPEAWKLFPDVLPTLNWLAQNGIQLGIISNWDERLRLLLRRLGLLRHFRRIIISSEVGSAKPSARIFELAARRLEVPPDAVLHVGDSFSLDARAARAAGFQAVHLKRGSSPVRGSIGSLLDLINKPN